MENTTKAGAFHLQRTKIQKGLALVLLAMLFCRGPLLEGCFFAAISFITYMLSRDVRNILLLVPAAAGILTYLPRGYDPWGDLIAMCVCAVLFVAARHVRLVLWQRALIASATGIVCVSIYRLATATVYKTSPEMLLLEGLLIFIAVFLLDAFFMAVEKRSAASWELSLASFTVICILSFNGAGLSFLLWPVLLFLMLWTLTCMDVGAALLVAAAGSVTAAMADQAQWGLMATAMIGITAAAFGKKYGTLITTVIFVLVCWGLGAAESGVVLGVDNYCLLLASAAFFALYWRFGEKMKQILLLFAEKDIAAEVGRGRKDDDILKQKMAEMDDLAELYGTYLDSRSMLANQFSITRQILEDARQQSSRRKRKAVRQDFKKFDADIAISQCAATGAINGDCCGWQEIGDGKVALVVSDGMGKGKKAAAESLMVTKTIMSLLKSGVTTDLTLKMINTIMLMKEDEDHYATVDLVILDKRSGKARFYKIGAAPTLIRRKGNVEEVRLAEVPLGIVNGLKIRYMETMLKKEDWIIMMSDGVSDGGDNRGGNGFLQQIKEAVAEIRSSDPQIMSDLLLNQAADSYLGRERDDLTVMVARIL